MSSKGEITRIRKHGNGGEQRESAFPNEFANERDSGKELEVKCECMTNNALIDLLSIHAQDVEGHRCN